MKKQASSSWLAFCCKCLPISSSASPPTEVIGSPEKHSSAEFPISGKTHQRKPGGWKAMPFVLGNETFERLATFGLLANFMVFLLTQFHMEQASAANLLNVWFGVMNFAPMLGAFLSDAYVGRFWAIAVGSFASLLGMLTLTLIAWIPQLLPPPCSLHHQCQSPTRSQMALLILALGFLSVGTGGIRPCSLPFGLDQFDAATEDGRKGIKSFFNWYYTTFTVVLLLAFTVVVYIQDKISWVWGFGIPTFLMLASIFLFFFGTRLYVYVTPEGSVFSGIAQAAIAAFRKRHLKLPEEGLYDPPLKTNSNITKLPLTNKFRFLDKAAIVLDGDLNANGSPSNPWRLCSIQQIEEVKCLIKVVPVWASGIVCFTAMLQQYTFTLSQALKTDRHLGPNFQIPPGSLIVISMLTIGLWVPFYDRILVPRLKKITGEEGGITLLQRIGVGIVISILAMVVAGLIERKRRTSALSNHRADGVAPITVLWLAPQLVLMGFAEAFNFIGQLEFYYREFPQNLSSVANSLFFCTMAAASYLSTLLVALVHGLTKRHGQPDWLANDINLGQVDYFYYLIAGLGVLNLVYFLYIARRYQYKEGVQGNEGKAQLDVELSASI